MFSRLPAGTPFLLAVALYSATGAVTVHADGSIPSLSAQRITYYAPQPDNFARAKIWASAMGFREQPETVPAGAGPELVFVANFARQEQWLLSPRAKKAARLTGDEVTSPPGTELPGGILTRLPCQGYDRALQLESAFYEGLSVEKWRCTNADASAAATQLYAREPGAVVWEHGPDEIVTALREIHFGPQADALFSPPDDMHMLSLEEFYTGRRSLPRYEKSADLDPGGD